VFNLSSTTKYPNGPAFRTANTYRFSMDRTSIDQTRSLHGDTDHVGPSVAVEHWPIWQVTQDIGDRNSFSRDLGTRDCSLRACASSVASRSIRWNEATNSKLLSLRGLL
jgi:hypothetical protein